ncbi:MAG TPA: ornithine cyclodeaminase family protein [Candidatus Acidoferrales bacterium]|nr:ornithine cyclodeaminase family protein [Candidatus Acidoferrales bacterium]
MPLLLTEADVKAILTMPLALELVETSFRRLADGTAVCHPRARLRMPGKGLLNYMAASDAAGGYMGLKIYTVSPNGVRFVVPLFSARSGEMCALIEADYLGQMRTAAASGVATRVMARPDASRVGIVGTGLQARTQLQAVALVRKLESIRVFGRDPTRREHFAKEMTARLAMPVAAASSAEQAVRSSDIVITATTAGRPVAEGRWLEPGMHLNAIGSNFADKQELDAQAVGRADVIAADSVEQSKIEAGDLIQAFGTDASRWASVRELADIVADKVPGRTNPSQITLFKSNGIAIEDVVVGGRIYEIARERGMGREVPMWREFASTQA